MNPEHCLVPYHCSELPPGPWVIFAPHADDETFGMGGALRKAANAGITTHVVVLTDGALGGPDTDTQSQAVLELVALRQQEVRQACDLLGVQAVHSWDQPDRGLQANDALIERVASFIADRKAATVFFPGVLELHPDHRVTAQLVWKAMQRLADRVWRGHLPEVWSYEISVQSPVNRLMDITSELAVKQQAMAVYASQNSQNNYPDLIMALNKARTFSMPPEVSHAEAFYCYDTGDLQGSLYQAAERALRLYWDPAYDFEPGETKR
jgi:N-acetylglucosamine malate deacetylase 1